MKHCANCKVPARCFLCRDCWRVAIIAPVIVCVIERVIAKWL